MKVCGISLTDRGLLLGLLWLAITVFNTAEAAVCLKPVIYATENQYPIAQITRKGALITKPDGLYLLYPDGHEQRIADSPGNAFNALKTRQGVYVFDRSPETGGIRFRFLDGETNTLKPLPWAETDFHWIYDPGEKILLQVGSPIPLELKPLTAKSDPPVYPARIHDLQGLTLIELSVNGEENLLFRLNSGNALLPVTGWHFGSIGTLIQVDNEALLITLEGEIKRLTEANHVESVQVINESGALRFNKFHQIEKKVFASADDRLFQYADKQFIDFLPQQHLGNVDAMFELGNGFVIVSDQGLFYVDRNNSEHTIQPLGDKDEGKIEFGGSNKTLLAQDGSLLAISFAGRLYRVTDAGKSIPGFRRIEFPKNQNSQDSAIFAKNLYQTSQGVLIATSNDLYLFEPEDRLNRVGSELLEEDESLDEVGAVVEQVPGKENTENRLVLIESARGLFRLVQCLSIPQVLGYGMGLMAGLYFPIVAISARFSGFAFYLLVNAPILLSFWSRWLLKSCPKYRSWIFHRYLKQKQIQSSGIQNDLSDFRAGSKSVLEKLQQENDGKVPRIWIREELDSFTSTVMKDMENSYFSAKDFVQSWRKYRYIPVFISMMQHEAMAEGNDEHYILNLAQKSLASAGLLFRDINYVRQLLDCGDFALIFGPIKDVNQFNSIHKFIREIPKAKVVVFSPNEPQVSAGWQLLRLSPPPLIRDIFVSYAHEDVETAKRLTKVLKNREWSVWWDLYIETGDDFRETIERQLTTARCVIVLWSKYSVVSRFVKEEANHALERGVLFPVKIDYVDLPLGFGEVQTADLTGWDGEENHEGLQRFLANIETRLQHPSIAGGD